MASGAHNVADLAAIIGATGTGKSTRIKRLLAAERPRRLLVWDWKGEYGLPLVRDPAELAALLARAGKRGACVVAYCPRKERDEWVASQFDIFCRLALAWGDARIVVSELSNVTKASWAPQSWRLLSTEGRHEALRIIGDTQRPALIDKTIISNATTIYCGRLNSARDKAAMADDMDVPLADIRALTGWQWLVKNCDTGEVRRADLTAEAPPKGRKRRRA